MIDTRQGYAVARLIDGHWCVLMKARPKSTVILFNAYEEPCHAWKRDLEEEGFMGLSVVKVVDDTITPV